MDLVGTNLQSMKADAMWHLLVCRCHQSLSVATAAMCNTKHLTLLMSPIFCPPVPILVSSLVK